MSRPYRGKCCLSWAPHPPLSSPHLFKEKNGIVFVEVRICISPSLVRQMTGTHAGPFSSFCFYFILVLGTDKILRLNNISFLKYLQKWLCGCLPAHLIISQGRTRLDYLPRREVNMESESWRPSSFRVLMHRPTDQWLIRSSIHSSIPRFISKANGWDTTVDKFDRKVWLSKFPFQLGRKPSSPWLSAGWGRSLVAECWEETFMLASSTSCLLCLNNNKQANGLLCSTWEPGQHQFLMYYECQYYGFMKDFQQSIPRSLCKIYKMRGHLKLSTFLN